MRQYHKAISILCILFYLSLHTIQIFYHNTSSSVTIINNLVIYYKLTSPYHNTLQAIIWIQTSLLVF